MKRKPLKPKICPRCKEPYYTLFPHMDKCPASIQTINQAINDAIAKGRSKKY